MKTSELLESAAEPFDTACVRVREMEEALDTLCHIIFDKYPNSDDRWDYAKRIYDKFINTQ